jgi:hypothetical protein
VGGAASWLHAPLLNSQRPKPASPNAAGANRLAFPAAPLERCVVIRLLLVR